jgi:hypothetical protein
VGKKRWTRADRGREDGEGDRGEETRRKGEWERQNKKGRWRKQRGSKGRREDGE